MESNYQEMVGWLQVLSSIVLLGTQIYGRSLLREGLSKGSQPLFSEKTTENSERIDRQARPGFEPGTCCLPVLSVTIPPLVGPIIKRKNLNILEGGTQKFSKGSFTSFYIFNSIIWYFPKIFYSSLYINQKQY